ncbi:MAG: LysR family transcriptional regulator [Acidimicrobiales bacterium]|nr:LysR family transcriptional regulator [Acidimicrobiales bacterium]
MQLDVESLRTLLAVLDHGGMTRAAEHLNLSQSAVSWKIKRLEERVGRPLLIRDGHQIRPTRDTRALLDDARALVEIHDRASARLVSTELSGTVRLGSNEEVDPATMALLLGRFKHTHPRASIEFLIDHTEHLVRDLEAAAIDIAIVQVADADLQPTDTVLWTDQLRWVTSCECWSDPQVPVPLITFGDHCFYRSLSEPFLVEAGIEHVVTYSASSIAGVKAAIEAGLGVGVLGSRYIGGDITPWDRGLSLPALPVIHQIVRTVPGDTPDVARALVDAIAAELLDPVAAGS